MDTWSIDRWLAAAGILIAVGSMALSVFVWWDSKKTAEQISRPHLTFSASMFTEAEQNGIIIENNGIGAAVLKSMEVLVGDSLEEYKLATLDLQSVGWEKNTIARKAFSRGDSIQSNGQSFILQIDRPLGLTDIRILDRLFTNLEIRTCYCDITENNCWNLEWKYRDRDGGSRDESSVDHC